MSHTGKSAVIYVVATPIGNLGDMTPRARDTLAAADVIAAEDTRTARQLLTHLDIKGKRLVSYQDHGEAERAAALVAELTEHGLTLAIVTDAGTPCVSDPGYRLVAAAKAAGIPVHPIPGASALTALVSASGLASDRFMFVGFLPAKASARAAEIEGWAASGACRSFVFFEATRRLAETLTEIAATHPMARVAVGRELTKLHEEIVTLDIAAAVTWAEGHATLKGEASVMVQLPPASAAVVDREALAATIRSELTAGATVKELVERHRNAGLAKNELYQFVLAQKQGL